VNMALLSEEGSGIANRIRHQEKAGGSEANYLRVRLWKHPPHDLDFVSIVLPS